MSENNKNIKLVFVICNEDILGTTIRPYVVEVLKNGAFGYNPKKITLQNYDKYIDNINEIEKSIIQLSDNYLLENLEKQFQQTFDPQSKDFPSFYNNFIRPILDSNISKIIFAAKENNIPFFYRQNEKTVINEIPIKFTEEILEPVFYFTYENSQMTYVLKLKHNNEILPLINKEAVIVSFEPCILLLDRKLYFFPENFDGRKLQPFLSKEKVIIPQNFVLDYFKKFIVATLRDFDNVHAKGFIIETVKEQPSAILELCFTNDKEEKLILKYKYGDTIIDNNYKYKSVVDISCNTSSYLLKKYLRDFETENEKIKVLLDLGFERDSNSLFFLKTTSNHLVNFVNKHIKTFNEHFQIMQNFQDKKYFIGNIDLNVSINQKIDWFDVEMIITAGDYKFPFVNLKKNILEDNPEYILPNGEIFLIPDEWFAKYKEILSFGKSAGQKIRMNKTHYSLIEDILHDNSDNAKKNSIIKKKSKPTIPEELKAQLRNYQKEGFYWMYNLYKNKFGGCLADDMGLGKTIQTLTLLLKIKKLETNGDENSNINQLELFSLEQKTTKNITSLIVMPLSLIYNWQEEINKFAPTLKTFHYTGANRNEKLDYLHNYDVILTTYGTVRNDVELLKSFCFYYIILDESHIIKNPSSKIAQCIMQLNSKYKLALSGTPIENSLLELWTQMNFLNKGLLGSLNFFREKYVIPIEKKNDISKKEELKKIIQPFILRRTKEQVIEELPPITRKVFYSELNPEHRQFYEHKKSEIRNLIFDNSNKLDLQKKRIIVLSALMKLRLIANHPALIGKGDIPSSKFEDVLENIYKLISEKNKVLIFSQFVKHLNIYADYFKNNNINYCLLTGKVKGKERSQVIEEFQNNSDIPIFLISLKAGGVGLNLISASYVFILDPWWNISAENQAIDRTHRIGQNKKVFAYKFIAKNTIEEKILLLQQRKQIITEQIIQPSNYTQFFSDDDINYLLE